MESEAPPNLPATAADTDVPIPPTPWGFWATIGWSLLISAGYVLAQSIAAAIFIIVGGLPPGERPSFETLMKNGGLIAFCTLASAPVTIGLCWLAAWLRKGISVIDYLALRFVSWKVMARWFAAFLVYLVGVGAALSFLESKVTYEFVEEIQATAGSMKVSLWLALYLAAPLSEEIFFRGFLLTGLRNTRLGAPGAIIVTTALFAAIHLQYDLQGLLFVVAAGLFLAVARVKTESLPLCIALHSAMNLMSTLGQSIGGDR